MFTWHDCWSIVLSDVIFGALSDMIFGASSAVILAVFCYPLVCIVIWHDPLSGCDYVEFLLTQLFPQQLSSLGTEGVWLWLAASGDRRVSLWSADWTQDVCHLLDWLSFPGPACAPNGTRLRRGHKVINWNLKLVSSYIKYDFVM